MSREQFRKECVQRDGGECLVKWCPRSVSADPDGPGEIHHIIERREWDNGGYIKNNGASLCNPHHQMAERNEIPPQAFYRWAGITNIPVPDENEVKWIDICEEGAVSEIAFDKWKNEFKETANSRREYQKYRSTSHIMPLYWEDSAGNASDRTDRDDVELTEVSSFIDIPLVVTVKMDGSNTMLVKEPPGTGEPVRSRGGSAADGSWFSYLKNEYDKRNVYQKMREELQVFGENMYAKHSIHYGCPYDNCSGDCDVGPPVDDVFLVFAVYDKRYDLWLSWPEVELIANEIGFPTVPVISTAMNTQSPKQFDEFESKNTEEFPTDKHTFTSTYSSVGNEIIQQGHEGIVIRSLYPFHWSQFDRKIGKYVRPNHVKTEEHWRHQPKIQNKINFNS